MRALMIFFSMLMLCGSVSTGTLAQQQKKSNKTTPEMWDKCREELGPRRKDAAMAACLERKRNGQ